MCMSRGARRPVYPSCWPGEVPAGVAAGWVPGGWYTGYYPSPTLPTRLLVLPGPNHCRTRYLRPPGHSRPGLQALRTPRLPSTQICRPGPIRARFRVIYLKYSTKSGVSPKSGHEACHTPYIKNPVESHDLEFPGFPYSAAFSHKE